MMAVLMMFSLFSASFVTAEAEETASKWTQIEFSSITQEDDVAIVMTASGGTAYILPNAASDTGPAATVVTIENDTLTLPEGASAGDYTWTIQASGDGYSITSPYGTLYTTAANNGIRFGTNTTGAGDVWTLDGSYLKATDSKGDDRWLGVYESKPDWRAYKNTTGNTAGQTVSFWVLKDTGSGGSETVTIETPTASYSQTDKTITFSCATSDVTYYYSTDNTTFTQVEGSTLDASGFAGNTVIYYYASKAGVNSSTAELTIPAESGDIGYSLVTNGLKSGDQVMIYYPDGSMVVTGTASGSKLTGDTNVSVSGTAMAENSVGEVFTISVNSDGYIQFITDEAEYLTTAETGSALTLEKTSSAYSLWTLEETGTAGSYYIKSVNAAYSGKAQYMEYYNGFTVYGMGSNTSIYTFQFYLAGENVEIPGGSVPEETTFYKPADGETAALYSVGASAAMTGDFSGVSASVSGDTLNVSGSESAVMLDVEVNSDGNYAFKYNGQYITTSETGGSLKLTDTADDYSWWTLEAADDGYFIKNVKAAYGTNAQYLEYYNGSFTTYSKYSSSNAAIYTFRFCKTISKSYAVDEEIEETIAQWAGSWGEAAGFSGTSVPGDKYAVNDMLDTTAYTAVVSGSETTPYTTGGSGTTLYYMGGKGIGSGTDDYVQFAVNTSGWGDMKLSFRLRGSNTAAASYQLQYSTDGENFTNFTSGSYSYSYTDYSSGTGTSASSEGTITDGIAKIYRASVYITYEFDVPEGAENIEKLYIRLVPGSEKVNGTSGAVSSSATLRVDTVSLTGSPIVDDAIAGYVTVDPDNSEEVASGTELTLSSATANAAIMYRFVNTETGEGTWAVYSADNKPVLPDELPAVLEVYSTADGLQNSVTRALRYSAGSVSAVKMSPNGGGVYVGETSKEVTLSTDTEGAVIYYAAAKTTDADGNYVFDTDSEGNISYIEYTENTHIILESGFGGMSIKAYAVKAGFDDSSVTTRTFTERTQENYNLYFGQLHSHTSYSDGAGTITDAYEHASEVGETTGTLDFLAVTDHSNSFDDADNASITNGYNSTEWTEGQAASETYTTDTFVALFGYEMTWSNGLGHINTFNTDGFQSRTQTEYSTYSTALQNYYETLKTVSDSISQFNHPGTTFGDFSDFAYYDEEIDDLITLIEVGNGEGTVGSSGYFPSYEYYTRALDKGWHLAPTNNQDNHKGLWGDANTARTVVLADTLTEESIYDAMRNYRVYATEDNDLDIYYTLDGNIMGSILSADDVGETVTLTVRLEDLTDESFGKVEVIVNGGYSLEQETVSGNSDTVTFNVSSDYSYYYIKVTEADGDIAVTSPVWVGEVEAVGISSFEQDDVLAVQNEDLSMTVSLFNNEDDDLNIESIAVTVEDIDGNVTDITNDIVLTTELPSSVGSMSETSFSFKYLYSGLGTAIYNVTVTGKMAGSDNTKVYTEPLEVSYISSDMVTKIIVDGTHDNDYVTGYYGDNMGNFTSIAADKSIEVVIEEEEITKEDLADCSMLVISAPAKASGTANAGDYTASLFEDSFIELVKEYVADGGTVIVCGLADYQDKKASSAEYHTAAQMNKLLAAIGSTMTINDDEAMDDTNNGGQSYRLYPSVYNTSDETAAQWLEGIVKEEDVAEGENYQTYSQYSGSSVSVGEGTWLVKGFETTYSIDSDNDGIGGIEKDSGEDVVFLAYEEVGENGGAVFAAGGVFLSDFEVDYELDNQFDLPYANTTITQNILDDVAVDIPVTDIADVRAAWNDGAGSGSVFKVQGYVTSGTSNEYNTFFDCIYIQDETGGMDIFPYAETGLEIGTKIEITGYLAQYQGDIELKVMSYEILDEEKNVIEPEYMSNKDAMDYASNGGELIQVKGTVKEDSIVYNSDGTISQFVLTDSAGDDAKIFIDGYIFSGTTGENTLADIVKEGETISAAGLLYMHPEGDSDESVAVLRVRNCDEIVTAEPDETEIKILYTNDVHSYIDNTADVDGDGTDEEIIRYSTIAGYEDALEAAGENVILVDAGDHIQGTAYGGLDEGATIIDLMNAAGYDAATLGNHEFDYDMDRLLEILAEANYEYVSSNFYSINADGSTENVLDSYTIIEKDGVKIAFVGITTPESITKSTPAYFQDEDGNYIYGIAGGETGEELYEAVQEAVDAANAEADIVIALGHLGVDESSEPWTSKELIANTTGIDAFIDGHSHTTMESELVTNKDGEEIILTQTGCYLDTLGQMTITVDGDGEVISTELLTAEDLADVKTDETVKAIEDSWIASVDEQLGEKIAESDIDFTIYDEDGNRLIRKGETNLGDLNADAYYWYVNEAASIDCDIAVMNGGGIRASVAAGDWTYLTTKTVNTFGNVLCVVEVSGQDILDALEFGARYTTDAECGGFLHTAGLTYKVDTSIANTVQTDENSVWTAGPEEYRVYDVKVYNKETGTYEDLDLTKTYRLAGTNYTLRNCGDGFAMFDDSYLVLDGIAEDYLAFAAYVQEFTDTDGNGYADIASANSPLASYSGYSINYEDAAGAGRITVASGKEETPVSPEPTPETTPDSTDKTDTDSSATPQTGVDNNLILWSALLLSSAAGAVYVARRRKRS